MNVGLRGLLSRPSAVMSVLAPIQFVVLAVMSDHCPGRVPGAVGRWACCCAVRPCMGAFESSPGVLCLPSCVCRSAHIRPLLGAVCTNLAMLLYLRFLAAGVLRCASDALA